MTRDADTEYWIDECIGPRKAGTRYRSHSWGDEITVLAVDRDAPGWQVWTVTEATDEELARGRSRTHCTAWDDRDQVISQPAGVAP